MVLSDRYCARPGRQRARLRRLLAAQVVQDVVWRLLSLSRRLRLDHATRRLERLHHIPIRARLGRLFGLHVQRIALSRRLDHLRLW